MDNPKLFFTTDISFEAWFEMVTFVTCFFLSSHSSKNFPGGCIVTVFELALTEVARHGVNMLVQLYSIPAWLKTAAAMCSSDSLC